MLVTIVVKMQLVVTVKNNVATVKRNIKVWSKSYEHESQYCISPCIWLPAIVTSYIPDNVENVAVV